MNRIESLANWLSDQNLGWWPFLSLRPPQDKRMDSWLVAKLCLYFGPLYWIALLLGLAGLRHSLSVSVTLPELAASSVALFLFYRLTFAVCWNRRAMRLAAVRALRVRSEDEF